MQKPIKPEAILLASIASQNHPMFIANITEQGKRDVNNYQPTNLRRPGF